MTAPLTAAGLPGTDPTMMSSVTVYPQEGGRARPRRVPATRTRRSTAGRTVTDTGYVLARFGLSLTAVPVVWALFGVGVGLSFVVVGVVVLALAAHVARAFAVGERRLLRWALQREAASPVYIRSERGLLRRSLTTLSDPQSWLDMVHGMFSFIPATVAFSVLVTWWGVALGGLSWILWGWSVSGPDMHGLPELLGLGDGYLVDLAWYTALGVVFTLTLPWVARVCAWAAGGPTLLVLSGRAGLQREIEYQVRGRQAARTAEAVSLRRLERDIHDGPQQRLVRLGMDLGRAKRQLADDPERARAILDEAIGQTRETLDELRTLSRGIAPPVLADRGLRAALEEVVGRATIPVHLTMDGLPPLPEHLETTTYFLVSEALTNVAKHSRATWAVVTLAFTPGAPGTLTVTVADNGAGGATLAKGHGLVGLSDRVRGVDGVLNLSSPVGGPTELVAEIPCAS